MLYQLFLSGVLVVVNVSVEVYIIVSTGFEKQVTNTNVELSLIYKMALLEFLNICLIPLLGHNGDDRIFEDQGLVQEVSVVIVLMNLSEIFRVIFHPQYLLHLALRALVWLKRKNLNITQKKANWIFENEESKIGKTMSSLLIF